MNNIHDSYQYEEDTLYDIEENRNKMKERQKIEFVLLNIPFFIFLYKK